MVLRSGKFPGCELIRVQLFGPITMSALTLTHVCIGTYTSLVAHYTILLFYRRYTSLYICCHMILDTHAHKLPKRKFSRTGNLLAIMHSAHSVHPPSLRLSISRGTAHSYRGVITATEGPGARSCPGCSLGGADTGTGVDTGADTTGGGRSRSASESVRAASLSSSAAILLSC